MELIGGKACICGDSRAVESGTVLNVEVDEDIFNAYNQLKDVRKELSAIEKQKDELEEKIKLAFTDAEAISYNGQTLATWKSPKASEKFDQKAFAEAHPELVREFTKLTNGTRRFLIK